MTKKECVQSAMDQMGWGEQLLPQSSRWEDESTGCPAQDLQCAFDWHSANHGNFKHWQKIFSSLMEFSQSRLPMDNFINSKGPTSYHSVCLFRVVGYETGEETAFKQVTVDPQHYVGIKRGDDWQWKDREGQMHTFNRVPVVDAWAYID